jgi:uncharacterized protein (TIGR00730 family)
MEAVMGRQLCVYCSSRSDIDPAFIEAARELGKAIATAGDTLVYGGGAVGLMGEIARATQQAKGKVLGVIPQFMMGTEVAYEQADELIVTKDMRERKAIMEARADAFIVLPGGFGTLEELAEILTLRQLKQHDKPVIILSIDDFYAPLITLFEHFYEHKLAKPSARETYCVVRSVPAIYMTLEALDAEAPDNPAEQ